MKNRIGERLEWENSSQSPTWISCGLFASKAELGSRRLWTHGLAGQLAKAQGC